MSYPSISVIVPIYNSEKTLKRCVDSLLDQTFENQEILLIDDGSTDGSGAIADAYADKDCRVRVIHKENGGLSSARNCGLDLARGEWISFLDADDWFEKDMFRVMLGRGEDVDLIVSGRSKDSPNKKTLWRPTEEETVIDGEEALRRLIVTRMICNTVCEKIYRRSLFETVRFPEGYNYEDIRTTYRLIQNAGQILLIPEVFYHYVQMKGSIVHAFSAKNGLDRWSAYLEQYDVFQTKGGEYRNACLRRCASSALNAWVSLWKADEDTLRKENGRIEEIKDYVKMHRREILAGKRCRLKIKVAMQLISWGGRGSMFCAYALHRLYRLLRPVKLYK